VSSETSQELPSILIVEDEDEIRDTIGELIQEIVPDEKTLKLVHGQEAIRVLQAPEGRGVRLVITDIRMPSLNGITLAREIALMRERGQTRAQTIVVSGATLHPHERKRLEVSEVLAALSKPFRPQDFAAPILQALQRSPDEYQSTLAHAEHLEALMMLGEMSAAIVHEIRNPLSVIVGSVSLIKKEITREQPNLSRIDQFVDRINSMNVRITKIIDSVAALSHRNSSGQQEVFSVREIENQGLHLISLMLKERGITLRTQVDPEIFIKGSQVQFIQVLTNLTTNAADAIYQLEEKERWIQVEIRREGDLAIFAVSNGGPLIPEAIRDRLFDRFFTTKGKGKGTGLGLPLCRRIAEHHEGSLELLRHTTHTCFEMRAPLAKEEDIVYQIGL
jgi:signal transduction histidine kinase